MLYYAVFINFSHNFHMENIRELYAFISTSKIRNKILKVLGKKDMRQAEVSKLIGEKQPNVSKALHELEKKKLTLCLTPEKKAWKVYGVTDLGKKVLNYQ